MSVSVSSRYSASGALTSTAGAACDGAPHTSRTISSAERSSFHAPDSSSMPPDSAARRPLSTSAWITLERLRPSRLATRSTSSINLSPK